MSDNIEKSLDEIIGDAPRNRETRQNNNSHRRRERSRERRNDRSNYRERDRYVPPRQTKLQRLSQGKAYLKVTNLHYDISENDLKELFEKVGETSFVFLVFDHKTNRSTGTAYLGFKDLSLNKDGVEKFDGRKAVGQIINVEEIRPLNLIANSSSDRNNNRRPRNNDNRRSNNSRRPRKPTTDDLDKELDDYMNGPTKSENTKSAKPTSEDLDKELEDYMNNKPFPIAP